tara:strand:+ start:137 stop:343 length:207 start_codon:yes stop_codon:yes gene_type:complete
MVCEIVPVMCPQCGESQNSLPGNFDPHATPFGPVSCMVCNHNFSQSEYLSGLEKKIDYLNGLEGPEPE